MQLLNGVGPDRRSGRSINLCDVVRLASGPYPWALIAIFLSVSISWAREEPVNYWAIEDAEARKRLPESKVIPAATVDELTPSIYQADGKQFVVVAATGGGKLRLPPGDAYVAFALP